MVLDRVTGDLTGGLRLGDYRLKILPCGLVQEMLKIAGKPVFNTSFRLLGVALECRRKLVDSP